MTELKSCIVCGNSNLKGLWNLGDMYPSTFISDLKETTKFEKTPFVVNWCDCGMVQLKNVAEYDTLFRDYFYRSSTNSQMVEALKDIVTCDEIQIQIKNAYAGAGLQERIPVWVEIANNDGCMSQLAKTEYDLFMVGVDPAKDLNNVGNNIFINDYFKAESVLAAIAGTDMAPTATEGRLADIVTCIACFYDLQDPHTFLKDVVKVMRDDGIFIVQLNDLWGKLKRNTIDDCVVEHVAYYSLAVLDKLFKMNGLEIYDFEYNYTNGSSLRVYAAKTGQFCIKKHVQHEIEVQSSELTYEGLRNWFNKILSSVKTTKQYLDRQKHEGKKISLLGASTKGNTLLALSKLTNETIDSALEVAEYKFGKYCLGSNIEIVDEKLTMKVRKPDIIVCMIWHFKEMILKKFEDFIKNNGILVFPLPIPHIIDKYGEKNL